MTAAKIVAFTILMVLAVLGLGILAMGLSIMSPVVCLTGAGFTLFASAASFKVIDR